MKSNQKLTAILLTIGATLALVYPAALLAGTSDLETRWSSTNIVIDGRASDWNLGSSVLFSDEKAAFASACDSSNIYLLFRTNDAQSARMIAAAGLTIYLDPKGGSSSDRFYLKYVGGPNVEELKMRGPGNAQGGEPPQDRNSKPPNQPERKDPTLYCYIKDRTEETSVPLDGSDGPAAASDTSSGFYVYEFRIPIQDEAGGLLGLTTELGKKLGIGLKWGDMSEFRHQRDGEERGPGGMGGGPGGMGGGPGGMGGGGQRPDRQNMPSKKELWMKTVLQTPPTSSKDSQ